MSAACKPKLLELVKPSTLSRYGDFKRLQMEDFCARHKLLFTTRDYPAIGIVGGARSYVMLSSLARLEKALLRWTTNELVTKHNFTSVTVPNILYDHIIRNCGFSTDSDRSQVYKISGTTKHSVLDDKSPLADTKNVTHNCIAGTSEFSLAALHIGDRIDVNDLPLKYCATSRCYRAETSSLASESGLYRVHYFNKVEMFAFTAPEKSDEMLNEFVSIQKSLYDQLEFHYQVLDMPEKELGIHSKKKIDIEAFMEGRQKYGEISSASNCGDYQASRLNINYTKMVKNNDILETKTAPLHTVNGTACASPRMLITLIEQHQDSEGNVKIPEPLLPYTRGMSVLPNPSDSKLLKHVKINQASSLKPA